LSFKFKETLSCSFYFTIILLAAYVILPGTVWLFHLENLRRVNENFASLAVDDGFGTDFNW